MKKPYLLLALVLLLGCLLPAGMALGAQPTKTEVYYFYSNPCETCRDNEEFYALLPSLTGLRPEEIDYHAYNLIDPEGRQAFEAMLAERGLRENEMRLPAAFVGDKVYQGDTAILTELPKYTMAQGGGSESVFYFLHLTACEGCEKAAAELNSLPDEIEVRRGDYTFPSKIRRIDVNINEEPLLAAALFDAYGVPQSKRLAPMVLAGSRYYRGELAIRNFVRYGIAQGEALDTPTITLQGSQAEETGLQGALREGSVLLAGIIGGLNPCALSMLLLVLSVLTAAEKHAKAGLTVFLLTKLITYLGLGYVFYRLFLRLNGTWFTLAAKLLLSAAALVLMLINVLDARDAFRRSYGKIRNQLPGGMRRRLEATAKKLLTEKKAPLLLCVAALGVLISCGEFLCSGQIYLATLLRMVHSEAAGASVRLKLLCYCVGFLIPSVVLSAAAIALKSTLKTSRLLARNMSWMKLAAAVFFAVILALEWLV